MRCQYLCVIISNRFQNQSSLNTHRSFTIALPRDSWSFAAAGQKTGMASAYAVNLPSRARVRASIVTACVCGGRIPRHGQRIHLQCGAWTRGLDRARAKKTSWVVGKGLTPRIRFICYATVLAKVSTSLPSLLPLKQKPPPCRNSAIHLWRR